MMKNNRFELRVHIIVAIAVVLCTAHSPAIAAFHLWQIQEAFTNADGSVQFIEMWDPNPFETAMTGQSIKATVGSTMKTFTFPSFPNKNTQTQSVLIATSGFGTLAGAVTPDFT